MQYRCCYKQYSHNGAVTNTYLYRDVYRTETDKFEAQNVSCTAKPLSSTEVQYHVVIGALLGLLIVLLVMAIIPWIWICWRLKVNGRLKRDKQQARQETTLIQLLMLPSITSSNIYSTLVDYMIIAFLQLCIINIHNVYKQKQW